MSVCVQEVSKIPFTFFLTHASFLNYLFQHICTVDVERDAEFASNGSLAALNEMMATLFKNPEMKDDEKDTEEVKELKSKRRSTIIQTKSWRDIDFGKIDLEDDE